MSVAILLAVIIPAGGSSDLPPRTPTNAPSAGLAQFAARPSALPTGVGASAPPTQLDVAAAPANGVVQAAAGAYPAPPQSQAIGASTNGIAQAAAGAYPAPAATV